MSEVKIDKQSRLEWLDILRVFGCICVLVYHVINGLIKDGMEVNGGLAFLSDMISLFHVPIFFVISGYLYYKYSDLSKNVGQIDIYGREYGKLLKKKFIGLGVPYFVFSILYIILSSFISSEMHTSYGFESIIRLLWEPVAQYWYLLVLMYLFVLVPLIQLVLRNPKYVLVFAIIIKIITIYIDIPIIGETLSMLIYFYLGISLCSIEEKIKFNKKIAGSGLVVTIVLYYIIWDLGVSGYVNELLCAIMSIIFLVEFIILAYEPKVKIIINVSSELSKYTLHIYLIHTWITGVLRVILRKLDIYNCWVHIFAGILIGLSVSLLISVIIKKMNIFNILCEPLVVMKHHTKKETT